MYIIASSLAEANNHSVWAVVPTLDEAKKIAEEQNLSVYKVRDDGTSVEIARDQFIAGGVDVLNTNNCQHKSCHNSACDDCGADFS